MHRFRNIPIAIYLILFGSVVTSNSAAQTAELNGNLFTAHTGLSQSRVHTILQDSLGYIWASTENGLSRIDPDLKTIENFNAANGLQSSNFNENACLVSSSGNLIFGSTEGALIVSPGNIGAINRIF